MINICICVYFLQQNLRIKGLYDYNFQEWTPSSNYFTLKNIKTLGIRICYETNTTVISFSKKYLTSAFILLYNLHLIWFDLISSIVIIEVHNQKFIYSTKTLITLYLCNPFTIIIIHTPSFEMQKYLICYPEDSPLVVFILISIYKNRNNLYYDKRLEIVYR